MNILLVAYAYFIIDLFSCWALFSVCLTNIIKDALSCSCAFVYYSSLNITPYLSYTFTNRCRVSRLIDTAAYLGIRQGHVFQIDRRRDDQAKK